MKPFRDFILWIDENSIVRTGPFANAATRAFLVFNNADTVER